MNGKKIAIDASVLIAIVVLLVAGVALYLHSRSFQEYALRKIVAEAEQKTGAKVEIHDVNFKWRPLIVQANGLRAYLPSATSPNGQETLATIDRVTVTITLWQLLHRQVDIQALDIKGPALHLRVLADGRMNLPTTPASNASSSSFAVQVASLRIRDGLIDYRDQKIPLSADLHGFQAQANFDRAAGSYRGQMSYESGRIETSQLRPVAHRASVRFVADSRICKLENVEFAAMHTAITLHGNLENYSSPVFSGEYSGNVSATDLRWILKNDAMPSGDVAVRGDLLYRSSANSSFLQDVRTKGTLKSAQLNLPAGGNSIALDGLDGSYVLEKGILRISSLDAQLLGGRVTVQPAIVDLNRNDGDLLVRIRQASLGQASAKMGNANPTARRPAGVADLQAHAWWKNGIANLRTQAKIDISSSGSTADPKLIPVNGHLELDYDAARNRAALGSSNIRTGQSELMFSGTVAANSSVKVHLISKDLQELTAMAVSLSSAPGANPRAIPDIHGAAEFTGAVTGTTQNPHIDGQVTGNNVRYEKTTMPSLQTHVAIDSRSFALTNGRASLADKARLTFDGHAGLVNWSIDRKAPLSLHANALNVPASLVESLTNASYPIEGLLNGQISVSGSMQQPQGQGHVTLAQAQIWGESLNILAVDFNAHDRQIEFNGKAQAPAGLLNAQGKYELNSRKYEFKANTDGLKIEQVQVLKAKEPSARGVLAADISGAGTVDDPQGTIKLRVPWLHLSEADLTDLNADAKLEHKHGEFAVHSVVQNNPMDLKGTVELSADYPVKATLNTGKMPIGPLLARFARKSPQTNTFTGEVEVHADLDGPVSTPARLKAHVEIPTLHVKAESFEIANEKKLSIVYENGTAKIENGHLKGTGTDLDLRGDVSLQGAGALNLSAKGMLDLKALEPWTAGGQSSGQLNFEVNARGSKSNPDLQGRAQIVNAAYASDALPAGVESLNGEILLQGSKIRLSNVSATAGGGTVELAGSATYGERPTFDLALDAKSVRLLQNGIHAVINSKLAWAGSVQGSTMTGNVLLTRLSFNQGSDIADIASQFSDTTVSGEPPLIERNTKLNVTVQSGDALNVASTQLSVAGSVNLTATGTLARPVLLGRVGLTGGEVFFLGKRFEIQSGTIAFANSNRNDPVLNLYVSTVVQQYNITINMTGTTDRLRTVYTSDPTLPSADIINLLAFGQTTADAASNATPASVGAESAVASAVGGQVASQVQKLAGISQLTINPLAGNSSNPGAQIAIQQRVTGNVLLTFSTNATSAQNQSVQVQYQPKKNVTVSVLRDEYGGYGIDVRYHKAF